MSSPVNQEFSLLRTIPVTAIPSGQKMLLHEGTPVFVTQALGTSLTVRSDHGQLFRIEADAVDALGIDKDAFLQVARGAAKPDDGSFSEERVWDALRQCFDPEIPVNIVDLGLIYDLDIEEKDGGRFVEVKMTLTAQGCGMGPVIAEDARTKILAIPGVTDARVHIVWDPVWTPHMISDNGRRILGIE
jgi:probable FeS assembly SUF system protein SufT